MKTKFVTVVFLFCIMTIYSCGDQEYTTTTTGVVTDNATGKPLSDAYLVLIRQYDKDGMTFVFDTSALSDDNGEYLLSLTTKGKAFAGMKVRKQGYTNELRYLDVGSATVQNYTLAPMMLG